MQEDRIPKAFISYSWSSDAMVLELAQRLVAHGIVVLSLKGKVLTFIYCKSGNMGGQQAPQILYELETVASKFGGKYAKNVLLTAKKLQPVYMERVAEMGIEVR